MPLDHFNITVPEANFEDLITFLQESLAHLGFKEMMRPMPKLVGMGDTEPFFWMSSCPSEGTDMSAYKTALKKTHIALNAQNIDDVKKFHEAALKAGGKDNGAPGPRLDYHPAYYGAYVRDPYYGINFEVVCHTYSGKE